MKDDYKKEIDRIRILSGLEPVKKRGEQINEGWLQNLAAAVVTLSSIAGSSQNVKDLPYDDETINKIEIALDNPEIVDKLKEMGVEDNNIKRATKRFIDNKHKVKSIKSKKVVGDKELAKYLNMGYHLTGIQTDTVISILSDIAPNTSIMETVIEFNDNAFFASGTFVLGENEIQQLKIALDSIDSSGNVLINIVVESSTDKQGLSKRLEKTLLSLGYSGDNNGLSQARNDAVMKVLEKEGVDSALIKQIVLAEQGDRFINPLTRYVKVRLQAIDNTEITPLPEKIESYPQTFELIKAFAKHKKHKLKGGKTCKSSIIKFKKGQVLCPMF